MNSRDYLEQAAKEIEKYTKRLQKFAKARDKIIEIIKFCDLTFPAHEQSLKTLLGECTFAIAECTDQIDTYEDYIAEKKNE